MMNLEWQNRLNGWHKVLPDLFFTPLGEVVFDGFKTFEHLSPEQALSGVFAPFPPGTKWGADGEYAWFRGAVRIPEAAQGQRILLRAELGLESLVWVNGKAVGSRSWSDRETTLTASATGGECIEVLIETYAGDGVRECGGGPCREGRDMVPATPSEQTTVQRSEFGIWQEEIYQFWLDVETLKGLSESIADKESLRLARIHDALQEVTIVVDLELPLEELLEPVRRGRELLRPYLEARNGSTAPAMHCFGHGHLDLAWLWPVAETDRKCGRTFSSQLTLMDEYPEHKFLQSQAYLYTVARRLYPEVYERVREAVRRGQWIADGAMWVESDTNLISGESLIRQFLYGKRFFKDEFGVESRVMWEPDVFGYSGALPQIMKGCRVDYFSTQKIFWTYNGGDPFPYNWFWWEGIDGSRVLSYIHSDYNSHTDPKTLATRWNQRVQKDGFHSKRLLPFGFGDGGGGPVRDHIEFLRRQRDLEGSPKCEIEAPVVFFDEMMADSASISQVPTWVGELYFQAHRGTLTTQARTKKFNRQCERAMRELELWSSAATALRQKVYPAEAAETLWKEVLHSQFHDIIPGSSVHRVYVEAEALYARVLEQAGREIETSLSALCDGNKQALTVFNSLSWERAEVIELPEGFSNPVDENGQPLATQQLNGKTFVKTPAVPAMGWTTIRQGAPVAHEANHSLTATLSSLENEHLKITLNAVGELVSIWDKQSKTELAAGPCNALRLYKDTPSSFDAWDIDSNYKIQPVSLDAPAQIEVIAEGPLAAIVRVTRRIHDSEFSQEIVLCAGSRRVEFRTTVDWREKHKLLKVNFPVSVRSEQALHEIQFGYLSRPTHASRLSDATQFEVCAHRWTALAESNRGAAVLNDCKYGVSVEGNSINLTLLRSPLAPDMTADRGRQEFTYAFYAWEGRSFLESGVQREAASLNTPLLSATGAASSGSLVAISEPNIVLDTVKLAEDGSGGVILRFYEAGKTATRTAVEIALPFTQANVTNMLEETEQPLAIQDGKLELQFRPFEVKTIRLSLNK